MARLTQPDGRGEVLSSASSSTKMVGGRSRRGGRRLCSLFVAPPLPKGQTSDEDNKSKTFLDWSPLLISFFFRLKKNADRKSHSPIRLFESSSTKKDLRKKKEEEGNH